MDEGSEGAGSLNELWLGRRIAVRHLADTPDGRRPVAKREEMFMATYDALGIEAQRSAEEPPIFIPWGAILSIEGPSREDMELERRDHRELMNRLADARTPSEIDDAKAAADSWLAVHPGDGDVRMARERLESRLSEDADLEEGDPT